jgi:hypothetical protein
MGLAWCLPTGFDTPITYFYVIYFAILLIHRQRRDDEACAKKYVGPISLMDLANLHYQSITGMEKIGLNTRS